MSENKYADDLLKQNSLIYDNWKVYRWIYSQLEKQPEKVKDELITFLGTSPMFKAFEADLPVQMGQTIELRDYHCIIVTVIAKLYLKYRSMEVLQGVLGSLRPAVVAMIASAGISILITAFWGNRALIALAGTKWSLVVIFVVCMILLRKVKMNPIWVMVLAGVMKVGISLI